MQIDIIIYAVIAAGLVAWLRSVLGTRNGTERQRPNPFATPQDAPSVTALADQIANVIDMNEVNHKMNDPLQQTLQKIAGIDRNLDAMQFRNNAAEAFKMIVTAFSKGEFDTLKMLLTPALYASFEAAVKERNASGETMEAEIHSIKRVEIADAKLENNIAEITLRFEARETLVRKDRDGKVIEGNDNLVIDMVDLWTFSRNLKARDPVWYLSATQDGESEAHGPTVPYTA